MKTQQQQSESECGIAVQEDWDNRQFSNVLSLNVRCLFEFLLQFDKQGTTRSKLAILNDKLKMMERRLEVLEAQTSTAATGTS
ncbi:hypothetical protein O6H91_05G107400 [Diphasiastrum complanatum]|uniref:Uncharacterized protein n=1 Tax=Diphasiastrum complanatum TaxID=34168 RepID=A0ACC2DS16_DIPCM|nr:hypothetical protein O6H91_05G107400 [Diphasiastrum complanatum]